MPKIARIPLIVAASLVAACAVALLCINLYLQSDGVQQRIHDAVRKSLGVNISIGNTSYTPWGGLVLKNISFPDPVTPQTNFVEAEALRIHFALGPLFEKRFVVSECILVEPTLRARQLQNGDWLIPVPPKEPKPAPTTTTPEVAVKTEETPKMRGPVFRAELEQFHIRDGTITFVDAKQRTVLRLEKVNIVAQIAGDQSATGTFAVGRVVISEIIRPNDIGGSFTWNNEALDLPQINGSLAGGNLTGSYHVVVLGSKPSYTLKANLDGVLIKKLFRDAGIDPGKSDGRLAGNIQLSGDPRGSKDTTGSGHFELQSAKLKPVDFLIKLGELLSVEELQLLKLSDAKVDFTVKNERVIIDDLVMKSENLALLGRGPIRFNGKLDLDAELLVDRKLQQQLKGILGKNFEATDDPEFKKLPFNVTGKLESPKTDLLDKLIGINIGQDMGGMLKNLFRAPSAPAKADGDQ